MEKNLNIRNELEKARRAIQNLERNGKPENIEAYWEVRCGDVLLAEENLRCMDRFWENTLLAKEMLDIAEYLEGYDHMLNKLQAAVSRMSDIIDSHPGLELQIMELLQRILYRIEAECGHELSASSDLNEKICLYRHNITCADNGDYFNIKRKGSLETDPIEWSAEYESCIDEAEKEIMKRLKDVPRGMGFCHAYWSEKKRVLLEDYGINWRSPSDLNPKVMFD